MKNISILVKPSSSACNMNCKYCFYKDEAKKRNTETNEMMTYDTAKQLIKRAVEASENICSFMFQGGEPTLIGLDFYKTFLKLEKEINNKNIKFFHSIQTNGYSINEEWAKFFKDNNFFVGLSLDGNADIHNLNRTDNKGGATFNKVINSIRLFNKYQVEYNVLSVVTKRSAKSIRKTYSFFKKQNIAHLQFIPCLDPLGEERGKEEYSLTPKNYEDFLISLFDMWYDDLKKGNYISIRYFDNILSMLMRNPPEACNMNGFCSVQFVIESDGSAYPCDFYVIDKWKIGSVFDNSFNDMLNSNVAKKFVTESLQTPKECKNCNLYFICKNGCKRDRITQGEKAGLNYYCSSYKGFFTRENEKIKNSLYLISNMKL